MFYSQIFRFLSPERQGRFLALRRDLVALHVAEASRAVDTDRVKDGHGKTLRWQPGEMVAPLTAGLSTYLESEAYRRAVAGAVERQCFRLG